jgi:hypothetical protein
MITGFRDLVSLTYLNLNHNQIGRLGIGTDLFKFNENLKDINFGDNNIAVIDPKLIVNLKKLTTISFENNHCIDFLQIDQTFEEISETFDNVVEKCSEEVKHS